MNKHTISDLYQMQSLPLSIKIRMTMRRIREWVEYYGIDGVYISFSGGKDSTVLLDIAREMYPEIWAVHVDTGLEYPEIRRFVTQYENVKIIRPKMNFRQIIIKYGYPMIGKEVANCVYGARRYLEKLVESETGEERGRNWDNAAYEGIIGGDISSTDITVPVRYLILQGRFPHKENGEETPEYSKIYNMERYKFFLKAPFEISDHCCAVMKKAPLHNYAKETGKMPMTAQMASESRLRTTNWMKNGCNGFHMKSPISNPMSFWTEQDVLEYIYHNHIPIADVYGEVVADYRKGQVQENSMDLGIFDLGKPVFETTGCNRTGCVYCGFGCHREKSPNRWQLAEKLSNPEIIDYMMRGGAFENGIWKPDNRGLGFWFVIEWINVHGNLHIIMPHREKYLGKYMTEDTKKYLAA